MKGFKATDKNGMCRGFQFTVGKIYETDEIQMCQKGFHFCENIFYVYDYYEKSENTRVFEVEALGETQTEGNKTVTSKIKIVRELSHKELLKTWINRTNSGYGNSGNRNSGYGNSGNRNSGNRNSGYGNSGNRNSGYGNSGNRNSGDWNSGDGNSGYFNTFVPLYFFNKPSSCEYTPHLEHQIRSLNVKPVVTYVTSDRMTEEEKQNNPSHKVTGGFLRKTDRMNWSGLTTQDKEFIKSLPNFDDNVFEKISGIRLLPPKSIKVIVNGVEKELSYEAAKNAGLVE